MSTWKLKRISHDCSTQFFIDRMFFQAATTESSLSSPLRPHKEEKNPKGGDHWGEDSMPCRDRWKCWVLLWVCTNKCTDGLIKTWNNHPKVFIKQLMAQCALRTWYRGVLLFTDRRVQDSTKVNLVHLQVIYTQRRLFDNFHIPCISPINTKSGGKSSVHSRYYHVKNVSC